jgi:hypothetical protein
MPKKTDPVGKPTSSPANNKQDLTEAQKMRGLSKGAMAAERASAGIGTDDRDWDDWFRPTKRL